MAEVAAFDAANANYELPMIDLSSQQVTYEELCFEPNLLDWRDANAANENAKVMSENSEQDVAKSQADPDGITWHGSTATSPEGDELTTKEDVEDYREKKDEEKYADVLKEKVMSEIYDESGPVLAMAGDGQGGEGDRNLSDSKKYPGISIYQNNDKSDMTAVTLPGFGIYIGGGYEGTQLTKVMQHEYGHYLDYTFSPDINFNGQGFIGFYLMIGVPSLFNAATGIGGSHSSYWTERRANQWAEIWFGNDYIKDSKYYPTK